MVEVTVLGVSSDGQHQPVVLLRHDERVLPILVGPAEANAIQIGLMNQSFGRPLTHDLIRNLLAGLRGELKSVTVYKLENETFYAYLNVEQLGENGNVLQVLRIDSRPSDGIALSVRIHCPIYVADEIMEKEAQHVQLDEDDDEEDTEYDA